MILSAEELKAYVRDKRIVFKVDGRPLAAHELNIVQSSIDLRLGHTFYKPLDLGGAKIEVREKVDAPAHFWDRIAPGTNASGNALPYVLGPGEFVLAETLEEFAVPNHLLAAVEGRSGYARLGISVHQSAPWLHAGWSGKIALEIYNSGKWTLELIPGVTQPCQVAFMQLSSPVAKGYDQSPESQFSEQTSAVPSKPNST